MVRQDALKRNTPNAPTPKSPAPASFTHTDSAASHNQISQLAYQTYQLGGCVDGHDQQDWFAAEQELSTPSSREGRRVLSTV